MTQPLRPLAWAIAIAGVVDPAIALSGASRTRLAVVVAQPSSPAADAVRDRLTRDLSASYEIVPHVVSDAAAAIVIGERYPDEGAWRDARGDGPHALTPYPSESSGVDALFAVLNATLIHLDVELEASLVAGRTSEVSASIAGLKLSAFHIGGDESGTLAREVIGRQPSVGDPIYMVRVRLTDIRDYSRSTSGRRWWARPKPSGSRPT